MNDLQFALRQLRKSPGFTLLAVLTLAIGIGMNTAIFCLIDDIFLRGLPFSQPARIARVYGEAKERDLKQLPFSVPKFEHYREATKNVFSNIAADSGAGFVLTGIGDPRQILGGNVTANYFDLLGIHTIQGRNFLPGEEMKADVALVTEHFWKSKLNSDPMVLGRTLTLNGVATTIVGVLPDLPISWFGRDSEIFTVKPFQFPGETAERIQKGLSFLRVVGRLKPDVSFSQAQAAMTGLSRSYREARPDAVDNSWEATLVTASEDANGNLRPAFITLLAAVGAVLLIACSNVANLLLVRFSGRRREISLRLALGAERTGIVRLFVVESTLVSVMAGIVGFCFALWAVSLIPKLAGDNVPLESVTGLHWPILVFTIGLSLATGFAMGVYPAWQSSRADLVDGLKEGGRSVSGSLGQHRFRRALVAAQVGLSVVLLAGAAMLVSSFVRLSKTQAGFSADHVWTAGVGLPPSQFPDEATRARFAETLVSEVNNSPGVETAVVSTNVPLTGNDASSPYTLDQGNPVPLNQRPLGLTRVVSPGYFKALRIPILSGRDFTEGDNAGSPLVTILSQSTAKKLFPNENPVGRRVIVGSANLPVEIIGVAGDVRSQRLAKVSDVEFYRPFAQRPSPFLFIVVRSNLRPEAVAGVVRNALNKTNASLPILQPSTLQEIVTASLGQERLTMGLLGVFAGVALLLAAVGIYGAVAYTVEQRTGEIGVRMALGAQAQDVLRLVLRQGMNPVLIGLVLGLGATMAGGRLLSSQLYEISPHSPILLGSTAVVLAAAAFVACVIPARRAMRVNPIEALRAE